MNKYDLIKNLNLEHMQKITLICRNPMGDIQILPKCFFGLERYIPYDDAKDDFIGAQITLQHKYPNKRQPPRTEIIQHFQEFIIYDGWRDDITIDDIIYEVKDDNGKTIRYPKYPNYVSTPFLEIAEKYPDYLLKSI